jgi:hypothetical protein
MGLKKMHTTIRFRMRESEFSRHPHFEPSRPIYLSMGTSLEPWQPIEHSKNE